MTDSDSGDSVSDYDSDFCKKYSDMPKQSSSSMNANEMEFMNALGLTKDDLNMFVKNETEYAYKQCNICMQDIHGTYISCRISGCDFDACMTCNDKAQDHLNTGYLKGSSMNKCINASCDGCIQNCIICYRMCCSNKCEHLIYDAYKSLHKGKDTCGKVHKFRTRKAPKYDRALSYKYIIGQVIKLGDNEYLYDFIEFNHDRTVDVHYYVKYYKNGEILADIELDGPNPWDGIHIKELAKKGDYIYVKYDGNREKTIKPVSPGQGHHIWFKSQPQTYSRVQSEHAKHHQLGTHI